MSHAVWGIVLVLLFVLVNGFFVAAEYSLVTVRRTRVQELAESGSRRAHQVDGALDRINQYVSATQIGVTMASLIIGAIGEPIVAHLVEHPLGAIGLHSGALADTIAVAIGFLIITYVHVVVGEIAPKRLALQRSEGVALRIIQPIRGFVAVTRPLSVVLNRSAEAVAQLFGVRPGADGVHTIHSEEELKMLVSQSSQGGVLEDTEQEMLYNVFDFADTDAAEVMVPRPDVVLVGIAEPVGDLLARVVEAPFTRYPVYRDDVDDIAGILHIRDLFAAVERLGKDHVQVEPLLRPAHVVPESKKLSGLLADFRRSKSHMALVVDEYGSLSGIVTMEDLIEEIVGEIDDEHDTPVVALERVDDTHFRVEGTFPVEELLEQIGVEEPADEDFHTVGGFVFGLLGQQPHVGDVVRWEHLRFEVTQVDGPRILHVDVTVLPRRGDDGDAERPSTDGSAESHAPTPGSPD